MSLFNHLSPRERELLKGLKAFLEPLVGGCKDDYHICAAFFDINGSNIHRFVRAFEMTGGFCDCEVYWNSIPEMAEQLTERVP